MLDLGVKERINRGEKEQHKYDVRDVNDNDQSETEGKETLEGQRRTYTLSLLTFYSYYYQASIYVLLCESSLHCRK